MLKCFDFYANISISFSAAFYVNIRDLQIVDHILLLHVQLTGIVIL